MLGNDGVPAAGQTGVARGRVLGRGDAHRRGEGFLCIHVEAEGERRRDFRRARTSVLPCSRHGDVMVGSAHQWEGEGAGWAAAVASGLGPARVSCCYFFLC